MTEYKPRYNTDIARRCLFNILGFEREDTSVIEKATTEEIDDMIDKIFSSYEPRERPTQIFRLARRNILRGEERF